MRPDSPRRTTWLVCLAWLLISITGETRAAAQPVVGDLCPELGLEELLNAPEGSVASLEGLRGRLVVLEFWATWCGPCIGAIPHLNELRDEFEDLGVVFISVTDEDRATVEAFQETEPAIDGWIGLDTDRSLHDAFGIRGIPATVVVDGYGRIAARTHPMNLDRELMKRYLTGFRDAPGTNAAGQADASKDLQSRLTGLITPGIDPMDDSQSAGGVRFVIRPTVVRDADYAASMSSGTALTALGMDIERLARRLYPDSAWLIDTEALAGDDRRFDLIVSRSFPHKAVEPLVLATIGAERRTELRSVEACRLVLAEGGLRNRSEIEKETGWETSYDPDANAIVYESMNIPVRSVASLLEARLGMLCLDGTGLGDARVRLDLAVPIRATPEDLNPILTEMLGLRLEPTRVEREVTVLVPVAEADG
ncbi:MAG: TlpA disulfide reductase family protein [Planctomycetota bacterium]